MSPLTQQVIGGIEGRSPSDEGEEPKSFAKTAQGIIGMGEGPGDLSTNLDYMGGYGE